MDLMQKILVVDDDLVVLATISMGLRQAGYQVLQVDSGELAVQICKREAPELAILDIRMPGMSGFEVAEILRKKSKTPFIFLSAYSDEESVKSAKELGALGYLVKPVEIKHLVPAIEEGATAEVILARCRRSCAQPRPAASARNYSIPCHCRMWITPI